MNMKLGFSALAVTVAGAAGIWAFGSGTSMTESLLPVTSAVAQEAVTAPATDVAAVDELVLGNPDAPVTVTEYASYTCPHCADFHEAVFKPLKADYIDTDKVKFVYREVYFDRYGLWASIIARCGGEMKYFGISEMLFDQQKEWAASDDPAVVVNNLKTIGRTAGMTDDQMATCLADNGKAEAMVAAFQKNMEADQVEGTPTIFVNGTKYGNMAYADLKKIIDAELAK